MYRILQFHHQHRNDKLERTRVEGDRRTSIEHGRKKHEKLIIRDKFLACYFGEFQFPFHVHRQVRLTWNGILISGNCQLLVVKMSLNEITFRYFLWN